MNASAAVLQRLRSVDDLPALPAAAVEVLSLAQAPDVSIQRLSEIIHADPALATRVLKVANSAYYRRVMGNIDTIHRAVMVLGLNEVVSLTSSVSVLSSFGHQNNEVATAFWRHCVACALIARRLAAKIGMDTGGRDFVAGLLHDIGKLVLYEYYHDEFVHAYRYSLERNCPLHEAEDAFVGCNHMVIGGFLAERWNLPAYLVDTLRWHHDPQRAPDAELAALIGLADMFARAKQLPFGADRREVVIEDQAAWQVLKARGYPLDDLDLERLTFEMDDLGREVRNYIDTLMDAGEDAA